MDAKELFARHRSRIRRLSAARHPLRRCCVEDMRALHPLGMARRSDVLFESRRRDEPHRVTISLRGASPLGLPYALARGAPHAPLRSRGLTRALVRRWQRFSDPGSRTADRGVNSSVRRVPGRILGSRWARARIAVDARAPGPCTESTAPLYVLLSSPRSRLEV